MTLMNTLQYYQLCWTSFCQNFTSYVRRRTFFFEKLRNAVRRRSKNHVRSAVDLSVGLTVNQDAALNIKEIAAVRNSENAMRRWYLTEAKELWLSQICEHCSRWNKINLQKHNVVLPGSEKDNKHMAALSKKMTIFVTLSWKKLPIRWSMSQPGVVH